MAARDDEAEWIRRSLAGDYEAFTELIKCHQRMIHALTFRMTGSGADAEDLAQDTFIQAFRQLDRYRSEARFSSWIYRIAMNLCLNWQGRRQRRDRLHAEWTSQQETGGNANEARTQQVQEALMKLAPKQRAAVILTTYDALNHAEAAKVLGCSEATVSWRLFTARAKLKKLLVTAPAMELRDERT